MEIDNRNSNDQVWWKKHKYGMIALMMVYDFVTIHLAYFGALWSRFDFTFSLIPQAYLTPYKHFITAYALVSLIFFWLFHM